MSLTLPLTSPEHAARYRAMGLWHDKTLYEFFAASAARHPNKTAIVEGSRRISYAELLQTVNDVAGAARARDLGAIGLCTDLPAEIIAGLAV